MDPLSNLARKQRQYLLLSALVGFTMSWGGIIPQRIEAWGISISQLRTSVILGIMVIMIAYFLLSFITYSWFDLFSHTYSRFRLVYRYAILHICKYDDGKSFLWDKHFGGTRPTEIDNLEDRMGHLNAPSLLDLATDLQTIACSHNLDLQLRIREVKLFVKCCDNDNNNMLTRVSDFAKLLYSLQSRRIIVDVVVPIVLGVLAIFSIIAFIIWANYQSMVGAPGAS